ncbi:MAG: dihydrofolate reductase [Bacteroidales bacterium]|jgi:dihydrofolate reductase|nr:dihydrofolate reductase [Bacteroidales bacterium]MDD4218003.1 dihydrofolate reductase [Bacteroidales bacterium]MDY0143190.1 dihydrofolate reductase [Bacteroidales bacterium]
MDITIIVAIAENNAIGKNNDLLWHISGDLKRFKEITTDHTIIMGRKTYLSLPKRPLPNRRSIVISDIANECIPDVDVVDSIENALKIADKEKENFIIGGGMVYKQFLPLANKIYLTVVHKKYDADIYFPEINYEDWEIQHKEEHLEHEPPFSYLTLVKK